MKILIAFLLFIAGNCVVRADNDLGHVPIQDILNDLDYLESDMIHELPRFEHVSEMLAQIYVECKIASTIQQDILLTEKMKSEFIGAKFNSLILQYSDLCNQGLNSSMSSNSDHFCSISMSYLDRVEAKITSLLESLSHKGFILDIIDSALDIVAEDELFLEEDFPIHVKSENAAKQKNLTNLINEKVEQALKSLKHNRENADLRSTNIIAYRVIAEIRRSDCYKDSISIKSRDYESKFPLINNREILRDLRFERLSDLEENSLFIRLIKRTIDTIIQ